MDHKTTLLGSLMLALLGCDDGGQTAPTQDARATDAAAAPDMAPGRQCTGRFVITAVDAPEGCFRPVVGGAVALAAGRLQFAGLDLAVTAADAACAVEAAGCTVDTLAGDAAHYTATLEGTQLSLTTERVIAFRPVACGPTTLTVRPATPCTLDGLYQPDPPTLSSGMCSLLWEAEPVAINTQDATLTWGDRTFTLTATDEAACTATADGGLAIYNGVGRTTRITAHVTGDTVDFTIEDALEEPSAFGDVCDAGRFEAQGARVAPGGAPLDATCDPLPFVCGDGTCDIQTGEHCQNCPEDCGCSGAECVQVRPQREDPATTYLCAALCGPNQPCGPTQRCVPAEEYQVQFTTDRFGPLICLDAQGETGLGGHCDDSRACGAHLVCALNIQPGGRCLPLCDGTCSDPCWAVNRDVQVCRATCGPGREDTCGDGACASVTLNGICSTTDRTTFFCHPAQIEYECHAEVPGFGQPCADQASCAVDLACLTEACTRDGNQFDCSESVCTHRCDTDADCTAPLGVCSHINHPQATTGWCRSQ